MPFRANLRATQLGSTSASSFPIRVSYCCVDNWGMAAKAWKSKGRDLLFYYLRLIPTFVRSDLSRRSHARSATITVQSETMQEFQQAFDEIEQVIN
jgi:hypothetical protein